MPGGRVNVKLKLGYNKESSKIEVTEKTVSVFCNTEKIYDVNDQKKKVNIIEPKTDVDYS